MGRQRGARTAATPAAVAGIIAGMERDETYGETGVDNAFEAQLMSHLASCGRSGGYRVLEVLKRSDFEVTEKVVFEGEGGELGPFVAKQIEAESGLGRAYEQLFVAQRRGLRCPNLPRIVDCWHDGRRVNVVMEWLDGQTLEELVAAVGPGVELAREAVTQLAAAVEVLHGGLGQDAPVIHRDLKPANVMVVGGAHGVARTFVLIDLGIARTWREGAEADTARLGTRAYAPPEQFGFGQTDVRSDVYALGAVLYFCLTGTDPAPGKTAAQLVARDDVPGELGLVVAKAMSFDPEARYAGATEFAAAVAAGRGGAGRAAAWPGAMGPSASSGRPRRGGIRDSWGRAWNALLTASAVIFICACVGNFFSPTPSSQAYPTWYIGIEFLFWLPLSTLATCWLLFDKRRLMRRFPALTRVSLRTQRIACVAVIVGSLAVVMVAGALGGAL